jgi:hypothetical protein
MQAFHPRPFWAWGRDHRDWDPVEEDPAHEHYLALSRGLNELGITIRPLSPEEAAVRNFAMPESFTVGGLCLDSHEVALALPSFSILAHEGAHALDRQLSSYRAGQRTECIAISVEHLLCYDLIEDWEPDIKYARSWKITSRTIERNKDRIEHIYVKMTESIEAARYKNIGDAAVEQISPTQWISPKFTPIRDDEQLASRIYPG